MDGNVSPMVLKTRKSMASPGIDRLTRPAAFIAAENTSPDAPDSKVRSRSKNAAPLPLIDETLRPSTNCSIRHRPKTGETPLGGSGVSQPEPCDWGNHIGGFVRKEPLGVGPRRPHFKARTGRTRPLTPLRR